jgi:hypothetical protein
MVYVTGYLNWVITQTNSLTFRSKSQDVLRVSFDICINQLSYFVRI